MVLWPDPVCWDVDTREARRLQDEAASQVVREDRFGEIVTTAGVDVAYGRPGKIAEAQAAAVVFDNATVSAGEQAVVRIPVHFPYVPGLLTFREAPAAVAALRALSSPPDLLLCDGHGIAHPRRCGFASHLGVALDLPSIGVAKSRLIGTHEDPGSEPGAWTSLLHHGDVIGACLRTKRGIKPLYVSIGHRISLTTAISLVLRLTTRYRLPEPIRLADRLSKVALPE